MKCIICRVDKDALEFSDEHVIPDSLGGYYHIYSVCRTCNSRMGETVDSRLVNHKLTDLYRFVEGMAGKSGAIPNPFGDPTVSSENPDIKARAIMDDDGALKFQLIPRVVVHEEGGTPTSIEIMVDTQDEAEIGTILRKKLKRLGIDEFQARANSELVRSVLDGGFSTRWRVDMQAFKIGLLKIAYEFAVDSIEGYFETPDAIEISRILREFDCEAVNRFVTVGSGLQPEVFEPFKDYLDLDSKKHYLVLIDAGMELMGCVKLHRLFCVAVKLSSKRHLDKGQIIFGINDIENQTFRKLTFQELVAECMGPTHCRLGYFFATEEEARHAAAEINAPGYRYVSDRNGEPLLFQGGGAPNPRSISDIVARGRAADHWEGDWFITQIDFHPEDEVFVRSAGADCLYRVMGVEISRERMRKL
ncbi:HNH endonuclease [Arenimonas caeni]|uniref:HNH endonuclease 5 domain-containing protein n=1 Tax=Arenimonas caeni TaxID=2058085 RepID=A0A2P6M5T2_9GAMM|nr:HNH endonuclease [Arenimonas caeni]PRH81265.1 hypothetical protein C6N40_13520 [Arenimonas caeni]